MNKILATHLEGALLQTRGGNPVNFTIIGERGIGKSSLLLYVNAIAQGLINIQGTNVKFLVIFTDIDVTTTQLGLVQKIQIAIQRTLADTEKARKFFATAWGFVQRLEAGGVSLRAEGSNESLEEAIIEQFAYSLSDTIKRLCGATGYYDQEIFSAQYDGVLILIDEADNASRALRLGAFVKLLLERVQRQGCDKLMIGLAGLPELRTALVQSHPSSLRLFTEIELSRLTSEEVRQVIHLGLETSKKMNQQETKISDSAEAFLIGISEGFPHFIQQFCYSAFEADTDWYIDDNDAGNGAFSRNGAMRAIGSRYYRSDFYDKIKKESYRQVLRIMADHLDEWVSKKTIRARFKGGETTLDNALQALRERHIIVSKVGEKGIYRLQNKGFAFWIKLYTDNQTELEMPLAQSEPDTVPAKEASAKPSQTEDNPSDVRS